MFIQGRERSEQSLHGRSAGFNPLERVDLLFRDPPNNVHSRRDDGRPGPSALNTNDPVNIQ